MQALQLLLVVDARRVVFDTDKSLCQSHRHPGGFCVSGVLVLTVPKCAGTVWQIHGCHTATQTFAKL